MTPQQLEQLAEMQSQIETLQRQLREFTSIPELDPQIKKTITGLLSSTSSKSAASATQAVNEAGSGTYNVMKPPTGFISIGGYNVPYIT